MEEQQLYDKYREGRHWENHPTVYAERFAAFLKQQEFNGVLVDIGCGTGRDAAVFQRNGFNVLGIDCSREEIRKAELNYPTCEFEVQDAEALRFADNSIWAYFMINVIHYIKKQQALNEIYRTLSYGGYLFIHFNLDITDEEGNNDYHHDENDISCLVSNSNFKIIKSRKFERMDTVPKRHMHKILELILQK